MLDMKKISQKDLSKLKGQGWDLTPDSKKVIREQKASATLSKQVEAITSLAESVDGIREGLEANTGQDYTAAIDKLTESIKNITIPQAAVAGPEPVNGWKFIVKRNSEGMISEIEAGRI
jgi:hypothetical protein